MGQARKQTPGGDTGGRAGRLAAGRRPGGSARRGGAGGDDDAPSKASKSTKTAKSSGKGGKRGKKTSTSPLARGFKLVMLLAFMAVLGFAVVLIVDVGATVVGNVRFGDVTFADLFAKVSDRVLDRDVPEPKKPKTTQAQKPKTARSSSSSSSSSSASTAPLPNGVRAPLQAPTPDEYLKHVEPKKDPEVEQARARLDQLLKGL